MNSSAKMQGGDYKALPWEEAELYKRNYLTLPLEEFEDVKIKSEDNSRAARVERAIKESYKGIKFDLMLLNSKVKIKNEFMKVYNGGAVREEPADKTSKIGRFMHSFADNLIEINADGIKGEVNILNISSAKRSINLFKITSSGGAMLKVTELNISEHSEESLSGIANYVSVEDGSSLELNVINSNNRNTYTALENQLSVGKEADVVLNLIYCGSLVTKAEHRLMLKGTGAKGKVNELAYLGNGNKLDTKITAANYAAGAESATDSRVIADGGSEAIMKGYAEVAKGAVNSSSHIIERGVTIDKASKIQAIPDMSISEKNVRAAKHKANVSPLDEDAILYLSARGIDTDSAKRLILRSILMSKLGAFTSTAAEVLAPNILLRAMNGKSTYRQSLEGVWV